MIPAARNLLSSASPLTLRNPSMSVLVTTLKNRIAYLENENDGLARAVDGISSRMAEALERLRPHDPEFVAQQLDEAPADAAMDG